MKNGVLITDCYIPPFRVLSGAITTPRYTHDNTRNLTGKGDTAYKTIRYITQ